MVRVTLAKHKYKKMKDKINTTLLEPIESVGRQNRYPQHTYTWPHIIVH